MRSDEVIKALKHHYRDSKRFFMEQVKNGASRTGQDMVIMDGVAILKSWVKYKIIGFEVKVSRWDFLQDTKRHSYLNYVHEFYFVVPEWLVSKHEIPEWIGLMYVMPDGSMKIVKRPKYMIKDIPTDFFKYIIFSKLNNDYTYQPEPMSRGEIRKYLDDKKDDIEIWKLLRTKLARKVSDLAQERKESEMREAKYKEMTQNFDLFFNEMIDKWFLERTRSYWYHDARWYKSRLDELQKNMQITWLKQSDIKKLRQANEYLDHAKSLLTQVIPDDTWEHL